MKKLADDRNISQDRSGKLVAASHGKLIYEELLDFAQMSIDLSGLHYNSSGRTELCFTAGHIIPSAEANGVFPLNCSLVSGACKISDISPTTLIWLTWD